MTFNADKCQMAVFYFPNHELDNPLHSKLLFRQIQSSNCNNAIKTDFKNRSFKKGYSMFSPKKCSRRGLKSLKKLKIRILFSSDLVWQFFLEKILMSSRLSGFFTIHLNLIFKIYTTVVFETEKPEEVRPSDHPVFFFLSMVLLMMPDDSVDSFMPPRVRPLPPHPDGHSHNGSHS